MKQKGMLGEKGMGVPENADCYHYSHVAAGPVKHKLKMHHADHFREHKHWHMGMLKATDVLVHCWAT